MRILADENFPHLGIVALRSAGFVVDSVAEISPGASDAAVLARALSFGAVILTFDKDFGDLARRAAPSTGFGVVLFRIPMPKAADVGPTLAWLLQSREDWEGCFTVVEPGRIRMRDL